MNQRLQADLGMVRAWIAAKHPGHPEIDPDIDLIEHRLIDSLDFAELLFILEEVMGRPIDLECVELDSFRTLRRMEQLARTGGGRQG